MDTYPESMAAIASTKAQSSKNKPRVNVRLLRGQITINEMNERRRRPKEKRCTRSCKRSRIQTLVH